MVNSDELDLLIEDLGLLPSILITPTLKKIIEHEIKMREFEATDTEKDYTKYYLRKLKERKKQQQSRSKQEEKTLKFNF